MVPVSFDFDFCGEPFRLTRGNALFWPREQALLLADLHLEKASFFAGHGQMLPPYDSRETLERVALAIRETGARRVYTLGDNFHDGHGPSRLEGHAAGTLDALTRAVDWVWITGNHDQGGDAGTDSRLGGTTLEELAVGAMVLRHQALTGEKRAEISGHFHPRVQLRIRDRAIRRPCAVIGTGGDGAGRMILPAFGALTGGMDAADPAIRSAMQPVRQIDALVPARDRLVRLPLWRDRDCPQSVPRSL